MFLTLNLNKLFVTGLPLPTVQCLRAKVGLPPKGRKKNYFDEENKDSDEEWTPRNRCLKKKVFKTTENSKKIFSQINS